MQLATHILARHGPCNSHLGNCNSHLELQLAPWKLQLAPWKLQLAPWRGLHFCARRLPKHELQVAVLQVAGVGLVLGAVVAAAVGGRLLRGTGRARRGLRARRRCRRGSVWRAAPPRHWPGASRAQSSPRCHWRHARSGLPAASASSKPASAIALRFMGALST